MERISTVNKDKEKTGNWFDLDKATEIKENLGWNGSNHTSKFNDNSMFHFSDLYRTKSGKWIRNDWSRMQGHGNFYIEISNEEAADWFVKCEFNDDEIPEDLRHLVAKRIAELEL